MALCASCLSRSVPCRTDADCRGGRCELGACVPGAPLPPPCTDPFEPNDSPDRPTLLEPGMYSGLLLCPGDGDWFAIDLHKDDRLTAVVQAASGDFDLAIHSPDRKLLATSFGQGGAERVGDLRATFRGRYYLHVFGFQGSQGEYTLELARETRSCDDSAPLDAADAAGSSPLPASETQVAGTREPFYYVTLGPGETLRASLSFDPAGGDFDLGLYRRDGILLRPVARAQGPGPTAELRYGPTSGLEDLLLRVYGAGVPGNRFTLVSERIAAPAWIQGQVAGVARYEDRPSTASGLGPPEPRGIPLARVEVYRRKDGYVVGVGATDAEGRFDVPYVNYGDPALEVRALALRRDEFARLEVQRAETCQETYAVRAPVPPTGDAAILTRASDGGGAFNIFATFNRALDVLRQAGYQTSPLPLTVFWERGARHECGSCYASGFMWIGGGQADPDEYDDAVLLHELGHYYEESWSRTDSPGGDHNGGRVTPVLAWSEGFATFFSSSVRGDPLYIDTQAADAWSEDLEVNELWGTSNGTLSGALSEHLVSAILWDLVDDAPGEDFDLVHRSSVEVLRPTREYLGSALLADRGAAGVDLVDYLDGWFCLGLGQRDEVAAVVDAQRFPYDYAGPQGCGRKPRAPLDVALDVTPEGPGAALRVELRARTHAAADGMRLRLVLPDGWTLLSGPAEVRSGPAPPGDERTLRVRVLPGPRGALAASAALLGPGPLVRPRTRVWPEGLRRAPWGRPARSARGRPLFVLGGAP
jgi:hypothetical protein